MIHLSTIGPISIDVGSTRLTATMQQPCAALLYLVVERGQQISRRTLVEVLFPESSESAGTHALRQLVYRLRKMGVPLEGDSASVTLSRDAATWDVEALDVGGRWSDADLDSLAKGYLSDFSPQISKRFTEWLETHRSKVSTKLRRSLLVQLRDEKARNRFESVDRAARACLALDPLNEEATLATAEVLVMSGSKAEALLVLDRYIEEVGGRSRDLRFPPKLLRERISEYVTEPGLLAEPPLVGREAEIATLRALLARIDRGTAEACVVWGASGIGKTRLLNEACSIAALEGLAVVRCALQPHDQRRPLAVLRDIAPRLLDLPGALGASPDALALMRGLCGRGEMPAREIPRTTQDAEVALAGVIAAATDLLDAVCGERSLLLCVEDAHWLDPASLELIVEGVAGQRPLCILMASQRSLQLPQHLADASRVNSIEVSRLPRDASTALMHRLFERSGRALDGAFVEWATALADGVPFYLHSLFIEYVTTGDRTAIPSTLTASLASKLERLAEPTRSVFDAIVVLGPLCTTARLEALVQLPRHSLLISLRELEERGLIRSAANIVACAHDLFAVTARAKMPLSVARVLHRATATMLEAEKEQSVVAPWDIAEHWHESGDDGRGLSVLRVCASDALRLGRPNDAVDMLSRASGLTESEEQRHDLLKELLDACTASGQWHRAADVAAQLITVEQNMGRAPSIELELTWVEASYHSHLSAPKARNLLVVLANDRSLDPCIRVRVAKLLACTAEDSVNADLARLAVESIADLGPAKAERLVPHLIYQTVFGTNDDALAVAEAIYADAAEISSHVRQHYLFFNASLALWRGGRVGKAIKGFSRSYLAADAVGMWSGCAASAAQLAEVNWYADDIAETREWFSQAGEALARTQFPDRGAQYYSVGIMLALADGCPDEAETLLAKATELYPKIREDRRAVELLAFQIRILLAHGDAPDSQTLDSLVKGHAVGRGSGMQDIVTDTVVDALQRIGRAAEADTIKSEYLTTWRRDRFPVPRSLLHLH